MRRVNVILIVFLFVVPAQAISMFGSMSSDALQKKISELRDDQKKQKSELYSELGLRFYLKGQMVEASQAFEKAIEGPLSTSTKRKVYLYLGKSYESSDRPDKAIEAYEQSVQLDPQNWRRYRDLAQQYLRVKIYKSAIVGFDKAIELNPKESSLPFLLGRTYQEMGLYVRAESNLKKAASLGVSGADLDREFSYIYEGKGHYAAAADMWKKTLTPASNEEDIGRYIALAGLAHNKIMAEDGLSMLKKGKASAETIAFYQSLIELPTQDPESVLALKTTNSTLKNLMENITK